MRAAKGRLPRIAVSMGDPSGIGPEVTLRALVSLRRGFVPILIGDTMVFAETAVALDLPLNFTEWAPAMPLPSHAVAVRAVSHLHARDRRPGRPHRAGGRAAYEAIVEGARLVREGDADALVTAPICKANLAAAGARVPGHTELLAQLTGRRVCMMMVGPRLRVALVTTHLALADVPAALTAAGILEIVTITHDTLCRQFGIAQPRIAVTGLNPHAGEGGLFGEEEARIIAPAVRKARRRRMRVDGPLAADGVFPRADAGQYDAVVCMYHDQGLTAFKLRHFRDGVNFTAGLPFVRTSPDHGTAHDIAGQGKADPSSMCAALRLASRLARLSRQAAAPPHRGRIR